MSIISKVGIDATGYKVKLDKKLRFYKGDCLNLSFSISNSMISEIDSQEVINGMLPVDSEKVKVYILAGNSITYAEVELGYEEWKTGDLITADKLNRIEAAIYEHTQMLDELLYKAITINNFSISKSTAELGEKLIGLILNWSYNKTPTYQKLDNVLIDAE